MWISCVNPDLSSTAPSARSFPGVSPFSAGRSIDTTGYGHAGWIFLVGGRMELCARLGRVCPAPLETYLMFISCANASYFLVHFCGLARCLCLGISRGGKRCANVCKNAVWCCQTAGVLTALGRFSNELYMVFLRALGHGRDLRQSMAPKCDVGACAIHACLFNGQAFRSHVFGAHEARRTCPFPPMCRAGRCIQPRL